jgi:hypothetical protein
MNSHNGLRAREESRRAQSRTPPLPRIVGVHRIRRTACALGTFLTFLATLGPTRAGPCALSALRVASIIVHLFEVEDGPARNTGLDLLPTRAFSRR